ncbi:lymphotoxin beta receptor inhibitor isoform X6 [Calliopsis andreniformis]|uniref:lymphotoxin beta receptor inhibitor isoform X6 n=1 Tax=Calliopsis andreniformis TaxID=337506 RepID=UPI003FCE415C
MNWILWLFVVVCSTCERTYAQVQRVPPGVSPQHYQQPIQQQVHQVPQHVPQQQQPQFQQAAGQQPVHQQVPVQQVPMQQQQHMPTARQVPVQQQQGHNHEHSQQILNAANIAHEKAHIAEHMEVPIDTSKMTDQELQFHYFKMHDADNNNKLDGCELIKSLIHWHEQGNKETGGLNSGEKLFKDEELVTLIDPILSMDDANNDGYIDYPEFIQAQKNAAATTRQ